MRIKDGDFNIYWHHDTLTPHNVRAACYGFDRNSGGLLPEVDDVIRDFPGLYGELITVRVTSVEPFGEACEAFNVTVTTVTDGELLDRELAEIRQRHAEAADRAAWVRIDHTDHPAPEALASAEDVPRLLEVIAELRAQTKA